MLATATPNPATLITAIVSAIGAVVTVVTSFRRTRVDNAKTAAETTSIVFAQMEKSVLTMKGQITELQTRLDAAEKLNETLVVHVRNCERELAEFRSGLTP